MSLPPPLRPGPTTGQQAAAVGVAALAAAESASEARRALDPPSDADQPPSPPTASARRDGDWPTNRMITVIIVLSTLVAGVVGFFLNQANSSSAAASTRAQHDGVSASHALLSSQQTADADYQAYVETQAARSRASSAFLTELLSTGSTSGAVAASQQAGAASAAAASSIDIPADLAPDAPTGAMRDPSFPAKFFTSRSSTSSELQALQDAENALSSSWGRTAGDLTAVLTLMAVALFLLGSATSLHGRSRRQFCGLGLALVTVGWGWALSAQLTTRVSTANAETAAQHYASGLQAAATVLRPADYQGAIDELTAAITARPQFARAYFARAQAYLGLGSRSLGPNLFLSHTDPKDLELAAADFHAAARWGQDDAIEHLALGAVELIHWLQEGKGDVGGAIQSFRSVVAADPTNAIGSSDLAASLLIAGRPDEARTTYDDAVRTSIQPAGAKQPNLPLLQEQDLGAWLSILDNIASSPGAAARAGLADLAAGQKQRLVASFGAGTPTDPSGDAAIPAFDQLLVYPNSVGFSFTPPAGFGDPATGAQDLTKHVVSMQWYYRASTDDPQWTVIPVVSGWGTADPAGLARRTIQPPQWANGKYYLGASFYGADCLANGSYRVEVYIDGHLAGTTGRDVTDVGDDAQFFDPGVGVRYCVPRTWNRIAPPTLAAPDGTQVTMNGLINGYMSDTAAIYTMRIPIPHALTQTGAAGGTAHVAATKAAEYAMRLLAAAGEPHITTDLVASDVFAFDTGFMGTTNNETVLFTNGTTSALVLAGEVGGGDVLVAVVAGTTADIAAARASPDAELAHVYLSIERTS